MAVEREREKKKRIDPKAFLSTSTALQEALLRATERQTTLIRATEIRFPVIPDSMRVALEAVRQCTFGEVMARCEEINKRLGQIALFYTSQSMGAVIEARKNVQGLAQHYVKVQDMIQRSMPTSALIPELKAIPIRSERAIKSLYNYIAVLEADLARKDEELVKKDKKIRELIRLLKEGKNELKEKYIA